MKKLAELKAARAKKEAEARAIEEVCVRDGDAAGIELFFLLSPGVFAVQDSFHFTH